MFRRLPALMMSAVLVLGFGACASDADEGYDSGVDGNLQVNSLTPDQRVTICKSQAAYVHAHVDTTALMRFVCAFTPAVFAAADDAQCEAAMTRCVDAFSVMVDVTASDPNAVPPECLLAPLSQCSGTVADYENCVESLADVQIQVGTDFSCGTRHEYTDGPTVGVSACSAVGPTCTAASDPAIIR